jgi:hypothetical protein
VFVIYCALLLNKKKNGRGGERGRERERESIENCCGHKPCFTPFDLIAMKKL